jgi:uncharacterized membrane protein
MAESLLETKLKEAIERTRGDVQAAVRLLAAWSEKDEKLLRALVQPFLQGILFHLVDRSVKQVKGDPVAPRAAQAPAKPAAALAGTKPTGSEATAKPAPAPAAAKPAAKPAKPAAARPAKAGELPPAVLDALVARWGAKIPVATKPDLGRPPRTVEEALENLGQGEPPPPGKASGRHQSGMRLIAKVQRMKRQKTGS